MAIDGDKLDAGNPINQQTQPGQAIEDLQAGKGITLPTSDPSVAGELWNSSGTVTVSSG